MINPNPSRLAYTVSHQLSSSLSSSIFTGAVEEPARLEEAPSQRGPWLDDAPSLPGASLVDGPPEEEEAVIARVAKRPGESCSKSAADSVMRGGYLFLPLHQWP